MNITVLGDGAWGTAISNVLVQNNHRVYLWGPFPEYIEKMKETYTNPRFLPNVKIDKNINLTSDMETSLKDCEIIVLALPTQYIRNLLRDVKKYHDYKKHVVVNIAKGIENHTLKRVSEITKEILGPVNYTVLSGPSHAEEVSKGIPSAVVIGAEEEKNAVLVQRNLMTQNFRIYHRLDVPGVELGGALKNVYSIGVGISAGMGFGDNSKAALVTRSLAEMSRLGQTLNGKFETFSGLSGLGDLIATCYSKHSRNRYVGEELGKGKPLNDIMQELGLVVAEGVKTTQSIYEIASDLSIETPIINELYSVLYKNKNPRKSIIDLLNRSAKTEIY